MLKTCPTCGKLHPFDMTCPKRIDCMKSRKAPRDKEKCVRDSRADKFRSTKAWQRRREEIRARDMNLCRYCFLVKHMIVTEGLSVHHIMPIEKNYRLRLSGTNLITLCRDCHEKAESGRLKPEVLKKLTAETLKM